MIVEAESLLRPSACNSEGPLSRFVVEAPTEDSSGPHASWRAFALLLERDLLEPKIRELLIFPLRLRRCTHDRIILHTGLKCILGSPGKPC